MLEVIRKQVKAISFILLSPEKIKKLAATKIVTPELYDVDGYPVDGGLMDLRMGVVEPGMRCRTCGGTLKECLGHSGGIELVRPILHVKYIPLIQMFLRHFCEACGKILLSEENVQKYKINQRIKKSKDVKKCPYCQITQEKIKLEKPTTFYSGKRRLFSTEIRERLARIPDEHLKLVGVNPETCRPEWAVLTLLLVPPVTVRPSITLETGERSEDDLTHKLGDIIRANQRLWENLNAGAPEVIIEDLWDLLQYHVTTFFDNNITRIPPARHRSGQPLKTITERIKGKEGRIRHNLAGKRVNYSSRSVISPDPFLNLDEVGVPYEIARIISVAETVNSANIERLKELILSEDYPGANYIIRPDGKRKKITSDLKQEILEELQPGYIVERHLQDGDIVLFNRHPSLHKQSLMAHYVKVLPHKTFRLHPAATYPYNADFDGDEMNIHGPQTEEARSEAKILLEIKQNLISSKNNTNLLGCIEDGITGNYLLSKGSEPRDVALQLLFGSGVETTINRQKVDGKEIFSEVLPKINFATKTKICLGEGCPNYKNCKKEKCPNNAYLSIKNGKLLSGIIDKNSFGVEDGTLVKLLDKEIGREQTIKILKTVFALGTTSLSRNGFSFSLSDLKVNEKTINETKEIIRGAEEKTEKIIQAYYYNVLEPIPGKTKEESREIKILQTLNEIRTKIGKIVKDEFPEDNPVNIMILSGARANILNIIQIACSVGQQALWAKRINLGYTNRTLSFFKEHDLSPTAKGFIYSSYLKGLEPHEFFFGSMTGRDALMDTALRTPKSGYLYRRLANALQDLKAEYDETVRDASENIVQFKYGDDGLDVSQLHKNRKIPSGEAVGIVTAQSFGEPSTQMALNVFHFAGVQEMQITLGLPRLIEIFDARKQPSTPLMEIHLDHEYNNEKDARIIAEKIREVRMQELISEIKINFSDKRIEAVLDNKAVKSTHTSIEKIVERLNEKGFKAKAKGNLIYDTNSKLDFKQLYKLKEKLKETIISGIKGISQVLVVKRDRNYVILTAGSNLKEILKVKSVNKDRTVCNNIHEIAEVLGIEAARQAIINEIKKVIGQQGLDIDERHTKLIADAMTYKGDIKGVTRMGIISEKTSILARASFETPIKQFVNATIKGSRDELASVIENVILNQPVPVGTGLPGLLVKVTGPLTKPNLEKKKKQIKEVIKVGEARKEAKKENNNKK
jgi:DNA-directed RNA polymerase subunit A'